MIIEIKISKKLNLALLLKLILSSRCKLVVHVPGMRKAVVANFELSLSYFNLLLNAY